LSQSFQTVEERNTAGNGSPKKVYKLEIANLRVVQIGEIIYKYILVPMPLVLFPNTQTIHIKSIINNSIAMNFLTLAGIEPGSAVPQTVVMSTSPRPKIWVK
jgi:hypothetical protein